MKLLLILLSIITAKSCGSNTQSSILETTAETMTLNSKYTIETLNDTDVSIHQLTITFNNKSKQASGFAGCNRFFGAFQLEAKALKFGPLGSTRMLCEEEKNATESQFLEALSKTNTINFKNDTIFLFNGDKLLITAKKVAVEQTTKLEYSAISRGFFKHIKINAKSITIQNKPDGKPVVIECSEVQWLKLTSLLNNISFDGISNLTPPTKKRLYDGAAIAKLKVTKNGQTVTTPSFDHGSPNKEIANLVKEILSIAENVE